MKVVIGIDGSEGSLAAVRFASRLLSVDRDEIVLYYSPPDVSVRSGAQPSAELLERMKATLTTAVFDKARVEIPTNLNSKTEAIIGTQSPKHGLVVVADECRADMIIVGARGTGPVKRLPLGSVGRAVVHTATIPVLIVREQPERDEEQNLRVLLACDGTESSQPARRVLAKINWPETTEGRVVTVVESVTAGNLPPWLEEQLRQADFEVESDTMEASDVVAHLDQERQRVRDAARRWCSELPAAFQQREAIVVQGHASKEILKTIELEKIDLVVLGSRGLGPVKRLIVGSTSEHLLARASCSILIARQHEKP